MRLNPCSWLRKQSAFGGRLRGDHEHRGDRIGVERFESARVLPARWPRSAPSIGCRPVARPPSAGSRRGSSAAGSRRPSTQSQTRRPSRIPIRHGRPRLRGLRRARARRREDIGEPSHEPRGEVLIEQELPAAGTDNRRRSRSAANARQARMSSEVRSGKSASISACDMPDARYSSTSYTVMRSPRMHGLPPRFPGSIVTIAR